MSNFKTSRPQSVLVQLNFGSLSPLHLSLLNFILFGVIHYYILSGFSQGAGGDPDCIIQFICYPFQLACHLSIYHAINVTILVISRSVKGDGAANQTCIRSLETWVCISLLRNFLKRHHSFHQQIFIECLPCISYYFMC